MARRPAAFALLALACALPALGGASELLTVDDLATLERPPPLTRPSYGKDPLQFGHLRLPEGEGPHPVIVLIHGGCWLAEYGVAYFGALEEALTEAGYATWSIEYRRVGDEGGGWPGTYRDVGAAVDHLRVLAPEHALDLEHVVVSGHSAGGALAIWAAARAQIPATSDLHTPDPLPIHAVVALAPAADLEAIERRDSCGDVMHALMGGAPEAQPERYRYASPMQLTPIRVPQFIVMGAQDASWTPTGQAYYHRAVAVGDSVEATMLEDAGHFEVVAPASSPFPRVRAAYARAFEAIEASRRP